MRVRHLLVHAVSISAVFSARDALLGQPTDTQGSNLLARYQRIYVDNAPVYEALG